MSKKTKGVKLGLGEFLGPAAEAYTPQSALPKGPRARQDGDDGYGRPRRREDREPTRSEQVNQWRGDRRGGYDDDHHRHRGGGGYDSREPRRYGDSDAAGAWRGGGANASSRSTYHSTAERPKLKLVPRTSSGAVAAPASIQQEMSRNPFGSARPVSTYQREEEAAVKHTTPSSTMEQRRPEERNDKWSGIFESSRRNDRYGGGSSSSRGGYDGHRGDDRYGGSSSSSSYRGGYDGHRGDDLYGGSSSSNSYRGGYDGRRGLSSARDPVEQVSDQMKSTSFAPENVAERQAQAAKEKEEAQAAEMKAKEEAEKAAAAKEVEEKAAKEMKAQKEKERLEREEQGKCVADAIVNCGKRGKDLTTFAVSLYATKCKPTGSIMLNAILYATESAAKTASWTSPEEYGDLLSNLIYPMDPKTLQLETLYALQRYFHSISFPKGLLEKVFMALYQNDILDEDAFIAYKYDLNDETPGKMKAIIETTQWLTWLETAADEEEDEEEEENFNL